MFEVETLEVPKSTINKLCKEGIITSDKIGQIPVYSKYVNVKYQSQSVVGYLRGDNQLELINQAGIRQQYVDQSVSLNLAFPAEAEPKFINKVHLDAWKKGVKTLYYMRTESVLRGDIAAAATSEDCLSCDG